MTKYFTMPDAETIVWGVDDRRITLKAAPHLAVVACHA